MSLKSDYAACIRLATYAVCHPPSELEYEDCRRFVSTMPCIEEILHEFGSWERAIAFADLPNTIDTREFQ